MEIKELRDKERELNKKRNPHAEFRDNPPEFHTGFGKKLKDLTQEEGGKLAQVYGQLKAEIEEEVLHLPPGSKLAPEMRRNAERHRKVAHNIAAWMSNPNTTNFID